MITLALAGLVTGFIHVLMGPDHLSAVAPFAATEQERAHWTGFRWGAGHALGILLVGGLALFLRERFPLHLISSQSERLAGLVLLAVGFWSVRKALSRRLHSHEHVHEGQNHVHIHIHKAAEAHEEEKKHFHSHPAFGIGILHGLAGSSHLFGVLPALALPTALSAAIYLLTFGAGTLLAMVCFSSAMGWFGWRMAKSGVGFYRCLLGATGGAAIFLGGYWLVI